MKNNNLILLIDEEEKTLKALKRTLEKEGFEVVTASNGREAEIKFRRRYFALVVTGLYFSDATAIELLKKFRVERPHVGFIIISGYSDVQTSTEALRLGADDIILKSYENEELFARMHNCLKKKRYEKILRMQEEVLAVNTDLVSLISPSRKLLFSNDIFGRLMKNAKADSDQALSDVFGQSFYDNDMKKAIDDCFDGAKSQHPGSLTVADGSCRFYHFSYSPVIASNGRVTAVVLSMRDLTEYSAVLEKLQKSEQRLRMAMDISSDGVWDRNVLTGETFYGENWAKLVGYSLEEMRQKNIRFTSLLHKDDKQKTLALVEEHFQGKTERYVAEFRLRTKEGDWRWIMARGQVVEKNEFGQPLRFMGTHTDITKQKEAELRLQATADHLEELVESRTRQLALKSENIEQVNVALTVLLKKREQDKKDLEEHILNNVKLLISPYLEKLKKSKLNDMQMGCVDVLEANLNNIISPFSHRMSVHHLSYTPTEIRVANLIKDGKTSKEIAEIMNLSPETISNHRKNIRNKSGIANKKVNLRTMLNSLADSKKTNLEYEGAIRGENSFYNNLEL